MVRRGTRVVPALEQAGHRTHALTLPGMESKDTDRSAITLRDHVDAVIEVIDSLDPADGKVVLVGHSGGGAIAHAAVDARPDRVARIVYVASEPLGEGGVINDQPVVRPAHAAALLVTLIGYDSAALH